MADGHDELDVVLHEAGTSRRSDEPVVLVRAETFEQMTAHAGEDLDSELGGVMVGTASSSEEGTLVFVEGAIGALHTDAARGSVTFTHDTWEQINRIKDREYPDKRIVGWYHTHPGFGLFLSGHDLFIHRNFFSLPWQTALVIDPRAGKSGFFVWRGDEIDGPRDFEVVAGHRDVPVTEEGRGADPVATPAIAAGPKGPGVWHWLMLLGVCAIIALMAIPRQEPVPEPEVAPTDPQVIARLKELERETADNRKRMIALESGFAPGEHAFTKYRVKPGDSLWRIAEFWYGDGEKWGAIALANKIEADDLEPGMVLRLPGVTSRPPEASDDG